jgi:nitrite reductase/ring-hydroxylating ferredoxin subunit
MSSPRLNASGRPRRIKVDFGEESSLPSLPLEVEVGDAKFFLTKGSNGYQLLSVICPHQGGEVQDEGEEVFTCDGHGWQFDKNDGVCVHQPNVRMKALLVTVEDGRVSALVRPE